MGDIRMIKGGACLEAPLKGKKGSSSTQSITVASAAVSGSIGEEEGEETVNTEQTDA